MKTLVSVVCFMTLLLSGCAGMDVLKKDLNDKSATHLGGILEKDMKAADHKQVNTALETLPTGKTLSWQNPDTSYQFAVTLIKTYFEEKTPCRSYTLVMKSAGQTRTTYTNACRVADGVWEASLPVNGRGE